MQALIPFKIKGRKGWFLRWRERGERPLLGPFKTRAEALEAADREKRRLRVGILDEPTMAELIPRYLSMHDASAATMKRLAWGLAKAERAFGGLRPSEISSAEIRRYRKTLPKGSRWDAFQALRQMLKQSHADGIIPINPAANVKNPQPKRPEANAFDSWGDVNLLADEIGEQWRSLIIFAAGTGLRPGEWIALRKTDLDFDRFKPTALVQRAMQADGTIGPTKTGDKRRVPLRQRVLDALADMPESDSELVFPTSYGNHINLHNWRARSFGPACISAGFYREDDDGRHRTAAHRPYDLRHFYATDYLRSPGMNAFTLARRMGTSLEMIERTYGHLATDADEYELRLLNEQDSLSSGHRMATGAEGEESR